MYLRNKFDLPNPDGPLAILVESTACYAFAILSYILRK
jgi:hypothetical protein